MSASRPHRPFFKVLFLGETYCGKSNVILRLQDKDFSDRFGGGPHMHFLPQTSRLGIKYDFVLSHPASLDGWGPLSKHDFLKTNAVVLVFSFYALSSLENLKKEWYPTAVEFCTDDQVPFYLIGNKCDATVHRQVSDEQVQEFIRSTQTPQVVQGTENMTRYCPILRYYEVSALKNINIKEFYHECLVPLAESSLENIDTDRANQHIDVDVEAERSNTAPNGCSLM